MENISTELKAKIITEKRTVPHWMDRYASHAMKAAMVCSDLIGLFIAGVIAVAVRWIIIGPFHPDLIMWFTPVAILMVIKFSLQHLYPGTGLGVVEEFRSITISISLIFIVVSTVSLMIREGAAISRLVYVLFWLISMVTIPALRLVVRHLMTRLELWGEPVAIIGAVEPAHRLYRALP